MHIHRSAPPICSGRPMNRIRRLSTHADCTPLMTLRTHPSEPRRTHVHTPARSEGWRRLDEPWEPREPGRAQAIKQLNKLGPQLEVPHGRPTPCLWLRAYTVGCPVRSRIHVLEGGHALGGLAEFEPASDVRRCLRTPGATVRVSTRGSMNAGERARKPRGVLKGPGGPPRGAYRCVGRGVRRRWMDGLGSSGLGQLGRHRISVDTRSVNVSSSAIAESRNSRRAGSKRIK